MKRQYDMQSILSFFSEQAPARRGPRAPGAKSTTAPSTEDPVFDTWLDSQLRGLYADVQKEEIPADMLAKLQAGRRKL